MPEPNRARTERVLAARVNSAVPPAVDDLKSLVRIPSIWADPAHHDDTERSAAAVAELARDAGAASVEIIRAGDGAPAVLAHWPAAGTAAGSAPTVLLYAHHDVQPTGGDRLWTSPPFEPTERDARLYGRGAADDKAGVMLHLAVIRAFGSPDSGTAAGGVGGVGKHQRTAAGGAGGVGLPVNVTLFIEGEEESGSPTLPALLTEHRDRLAADVIVIADSGNPATDVPALTTSLRGLVDCTVEVAMLEGPAHSGVYGGPLGDGLTALCRLLATLHDDKGRVAVPNLVVRDWDSPGSPGTVGTVGTVDFDEATFRCDAGVLDGVELIGAGTLPERLWYQPAVAVLGIDAPSVAEAANVLLPSARAVVSLRLAPGDDPARAQRALTEHLRAHAPWGARVTVRSGATIAPFQLDPDGPPHGTVYEVARRTFAAAYGNVAVEMGVGGSIPFIAEFARAFPGAAVLVTGVGDPASRWHGIDESLSLDMFAKAVLAEALLLAGLVPRAN